MYAGYRPPTGTVSAAAQPTASAPAGATPIRRFQVAGAVRAPAPPTTVLAAELPPDTQVMVGPGGAALAGMAENCAWCRYGKPAVAGAVLGGAGAYFMGGEVGSGVIWGTASGLALGWYRG
jgi:hypothetical protein